VKKFLLLLCSILVFGGCSNNDINSNLLNDLPEAFIACKAEKNSNDNGFSLTCSRGKESFTCYDTEDGVDCINKYKKYINISDDEIISENLKKFELDNIENVVKFINTLKGIPENYSLCTVDVVYYGVDLSCAKYDKNLKLTKQDMKACTKGDKKLCAEVLKIKSTKGFTVVSKHNRSNDISNGIEDIYKLINSK
jgi:hypothetical protein